MKHLSWSIALLCLLMPFAGAQTLARVRIDTDGAVELARTLESAGFDVLPVEPATSAIELIASSAEIVELQARGLRPVVVERGRPFWEIMAERDGPGGVPSGYMDLASILAQMNQVAASFPAIAQVVDLTAAYGTPTTFEGRHQFGMKISANVAQTEDEPAILIVSNHHARELVTPVVALDTIDRLTGQYGIDAQITAIVDGNEIWVLPTWNPDGYEHVFNSDNFWRKNRHVFSNGTGVDQNRNYPQGWFDSCSGSTSQSSNTYKGPSPASESETQTMMALSLDRRFAKVVDFHSQGREVIYGYSCEPHPFTNYYLAEATTLSGLCGYFDETPASAHGEHYQWQFANLGSLSFLVETQLQWQPPYNDAVAEAAMVWPGTLWMLERQIPLSGHVTDSCSGEPLAATVSLPGVNFTEGETNSSGGAFGRYHSYMPPGQYQVRFEAQGYMTQDVPVTIVAGVATTLDVALDPTSGATNYCVGAPNSAGPGASIFHTGSTSVVANDLVLNVIGAAPNENCLFVYGQNQVQVPLYDGFLCVGNPFVRLPVVTTDGSGSVQFALDVQNPPIPAGTITAGSSWSFQLFYRDTASAGAGANLSDGLAIPFCL